MRRIGRGSLIVALSGVMCLAACAESAPPGSDVQVEDAWVRAVVGPNANTAAYMVLRNAGSAPGRLTGAQSDAARMTELHRTTIDEAGLARMGHVEALDVPAGGVVTLEPGGYHLMLMGVGSLAVGDTVEITLGLESADPLHVAAEVRAF
jgi:copper(I)-binding protein